MPPHFPFKKLAGWWILSLGVILIGLGMLQWRVNQNLATPLSSNTSFRFLTGQILSDTTNKVVYGFVPYWNLDEMEVQPELTHLGYFGLPITGQGKIATSEQQSGDYIGYSRLQSDLFLTRLSELEANQTQL
jgi:hypothetical protein